MKRLLVLTLTAALLLCLCACEEELQASEPIQTTAPTTVPVATSSEKDPQLGSYADGVYVNEFIGIRCQVGNGWTVYSDAQLAQLNGLVLDTMTDADLVEQLKKSNVGHLFYATADGGHRTMNVVLENIGVINGVLLDEKTYVSLAVEQIPTALQSMGLSNVQAEPSMVLFAGREHAAVQVHGFYSDVDFYEKIVCIKVGSYFGLVTVASYHEDQTEELLAMFAAE